MSHYIEFLLMLVATDNEHCCCWQLMRKHFGNQPLYEFAEPTEVAICGCDCLLSLIKLGVSLSALPSCVSQLLALSLPHV